MKKVPALSLTVLFLAAVLLAPRPAARAAELEEALPESTVVFLKVADWGKTRKDLEATALGKILAEEDVQEYLKGVGAAFDKVIAALEKKTGVKSADLGAAYGTELALAVLGPDKQAAEAYLAKGPQAKAPPPFVVAVIAKVGDAAAAGRINATIEAAMKALPKAEQKPVAWGEVKGLCTREAGDPEEVGVFSLRAGAYQLWAVAFAEAGAKELAAALAAGKCAKSLAAAEDFKLCRAKLGARTDLLWYLGIRKGLEQSLACVQEKDRAEATKLLEALRFGDIIAAAGSVAVEAPGFRSRSFLACKDGDDGVVGLVGREPLPPELLKLAPANATGLVAGSFRFDRVLPLIRKVAGAVDKDGAAKMDEGLGGLKAVMGVDLEKDLLGALSGRGCIFAMPSQSVGGNPLLGQVNGLVIAAEVRDAAALRGAAAKLVELAKAALAGRGGPFGEEGGNKGAQDMVTTFDYRGQKVTSFNLMMVAPGFAVTDKYLVVGGSVQAVKKAIGQIAGGEALVDTPAYRKAMAAVDAKDATGLSYMNLSDSVATAVAAAGMLSGFALPAIAGMREGLGRRDRSSSKNNLRQIGIACHLFADENDEKFPPNLLALFPLQVDNKKFYLCPTFGKHAADGVDYAYVAGLTAADPGDTVLAYEPVAGANGMVNVLYVDAHVATVKLEDAKKALEAQAKRLKENKREMKVLEPKGVEAGGAATTPAAEELDPDLFIELLKALVNPAAMPAPESFTKHLFPGVSVTRRAEGGILSESYSPLGFAGGPGIGGGGTGVAGVSIIAAIAIPSLLAARRSSLETNAVGSCRAYAEAQTIFKRNDWDGDGVLAYAKDFKELHSTKDGQGNPIQLIDAAFAAAADKDHPKHGYYFVNMKTIGGKAIDWKNDFALCAVPAVYGRTGYRTFIINTNGTVFGKDLGASTAVEDYPAEPQKAGWIIAE